VPIDDQGRLIQASYEVLLRTRPKLVAFNHVSNGLGTINPVREMVAMAHEAGALVLVDGAQAAPHLPVDVQEIGADFYVFSGHKTLGPPGSGALWAKRELLESMPPFLAGGEMIREVHLRRTEFNDVPWKFEAGTPDIGSAIGLGAALTYLEGIGMDAVRAHERELVAYALDVLPRQVPRYHYGAWPRRARRRCDSTRPASTLTARPLLDREAIAVRRPNCTQPSTNGSAAATAEPASVSTAMRRHRSGGAAGPRTCGDLRRDGQRRGDDAPLAPRG
jgi:cysteine desulfurase/selenocysteine lyase